MRHEMKRYAFISYNHRDVKAAKWLQNKLEGYKLPSDTYNEFEDSKYLRPVFRDKTDLNTGILSEELKKHLETSKYLIVICSPNSANSKWVSAEIQAFVDMGRLDHIIPFIIDGQPHGGVNECIPVALRQINELFPEKELLGVNIQEVGKHEAFVRVVSRMLGVEFDELWKRYERERRIKMLLISILTPICISLFCYFAIPITISLRINDEQHNLPMPDDAIVLIDGIEYRISKIDTTLFVNDMPGYYRGRTISILFQASFYGRISVEKTLGLGCSNEISIQAKRDSTFAVFAGEVIDENGIPLQDVIVKVSDQKAMTTSDGQFYIIIPLKSQAETQKITLNKKGFETIVREDECPNEKLRYILHPSR